jgi:hypothetical protein
MSSPPKPPQDPSPVWIRCRANLKLDPAKRCKGNQAAPELIWGEKGQGQKIRYKCLTCKKIFYVEF